MSKIAKLVVALCLAAGVPALAVADSSTQRAAKDLAPRPGVGKATSPLAQVAPVVTEASGACNSKLIQFVDDPAGVNYNQFGEYRVPIAPSGILDVGNCRHLHYEIGSGAGTGYSLFMGKITGSTLAEAFPGTVRNKIQSMEIKGPHIAFLMQGAANTSEQVQMWFYLTD